MMKEKIKRRVGLNATATDYVQKTIARIKKESKFSKVNESSFCSKLIIHYFKNHYEKDKKAFEELFIDKKAYLKDIIQSCESDDQILNSVQSFLKKKTPRKTQGVKAE